MKTSRRNYLLLELGDNDFSTHLKETLNIVDASLDLDVASEADVKAFVVQYMIGLDICYKACNNSVVDWERSKKTTEYLESKLIVSFPKTIDYSKDYDSGAACLDIRFGMVSILRNALY